MTIRYIADTHFDHADIIPYDNRPFDALGEMNDALVRNWNRVVRDPEDLTWILGDFCSGDARRWREILGKLNGRKALILGNHDDRSAVDAVRDLLEDVSEYRETIDGETHVVLCHYPVFGFRDHYFGWVHLYGHVHASYEWNVTENAKRLLQRLYVRDDVCRMYNVGAMMSYMAYTPRTLEEIMG